MNDFSRRIKNIEDELLNLKTASKYTSARPMNYATVEVTASGVYRIEYESNDENILSIVLNALPIQIYEEVKARTISGRSQDVEIYIDPSLVGSTIQLTVLSTAAVVDFTRVS